MLYMNDIDFGKIIFNYTGEFHVSNLWLVTNHHTVITKQITNFMDLGLV